RLLANASGISMSKNFRCIRTIDGVYLCAGVLPIEFPLDIAGNEVGQLAAAGHPPDNLFRVSRGSKSAESDHLPVSAGWYLFQIWQIRHVDALHHSRHASHSIFWGLVQ